MLKLRVQTVDPWVRVLLTLTGVALAGLGIWSMASEASGPGIALLLFGILTLCASIVG